MNGRIYRIHHLGGERIGCREAGCDAYRNGWKTVVDEATPLGKAQAGYIRHRSGRMFREGQEVPGLTVFYFAPGQQCFAQHSMEYANLQRRRPREDFDVIPLDRFTGEWNEIVARAK